MVTLTVFLQTVGLFAVAPLEMFVILYLLAERIGVSVHQGENGVVAFLVIDLQIMATLAVASLTGLIEAEAITV